MNAPPLLIVVLTSCLLATTGWPSSLCAQCEGDLTSIGVLPLNDLGVGLYAESFPGGLYPDATSTRPPLHEAAGIELAHTSVRPRDATGAPDLEQGLIGMLSIGMSNTSQEFSAFLQRANADPARNPQLVIVNGAQGGKAAEDWVNTATPWEVLAARVASAGLSPGQVEVVWMKHANRRPGDIGAFDTHARQLESDLAAILRKLKQEYPNLALAYLSSRTRAYTDNPGGLNPEPFAFESGFSVRWVIEDQLSAQNQLSYELGEAPWLSWGPYLWVDGENARSDELVWLAADLNNDCTHPSASGREKVADQLVAFLKTDPTATPWYVRPTESADAPAVIVEPESASGEAPLTVTFDVTAAARGVGRTIAEFAWGFGDGGTSLTQNATKSFPVAAEYSTYLTVTDSDGNTTVVTIPISVTETGEPPVEPELRRGDCNDDGVVDLSDAVFDLGFLFVGGPAPGCIEACNTNGDLENDLADAVFLLSHVFLGGSSPEAPFPGCGLDPSPEDSLGCAVTACP